jgi:hypothetical protein
MRDTHETYVTYNSFKEADPILFERSGLKNKPYRWGDTVRKCTKLEEEIGASLTREQILIVSDSHRKGAKAEEKKRKERQKKVAKNYKEARDLEQYKEYSYPANRNWSYTGDIGDDGQDEIKVHVKKPRTFTPYQYDPEKALARVLRHLNEGQTTTFLDALAKDINKDLGATRLKTSYGMVAYEGEGPSTGGGSNEGTETELSGSVELKSGYPVLDNNSEFSDGYDFGKGTVPGQDLSGDDRKLLGTYINREELDSEALHGSHKLGRDKEGRTVKQAQEAFEETWEQDQREQRAKEAADRRDWQKTIKTPD